MRRGPAVTRENIWCFAQNKPSLIVDDLAETPEEVNVVYESLLRRGVFKWLSVRRGLITLKNTWLARLKSADAEWSTVKHAHPNRAAYLKGYRAAIRECRAEVRSLCHSPRWACPDFDRKANEWLSSMEHHTQGL